MNEGKEVIPDERAEADFHERFDPPETAKLQDGEDPFAGVNVAPTGVDDNGLDPEWHQRKPNRKPIPLPEPVTDIERLPKPDVAGKDFSFDNIADEFDRHIELSIPGYKDLHRMVVDFVKFFAVNKTSIIDIGASTGTLLKAIREELDRIGKYGSVEYIAVEPEFKFAEFIERQNFCTIIGQTFETIPSDYFSTKEVSIITMLFTFQFMTEPVRQRTLSKIYNMLQEDGILIISEKTFTDTGRLQHIMDMQYYLFKAKAFSFEQIVGKAEALATIMRPVTESRLLDLLLSAGFKAVTPFWRNLNFGGWICQK